MRRYRVIQYGLGAMGSGMVRMMLHKADVEIVGAISASGRSVGMDLGRAVGMDEQLGVVVSGNPEQVLKEVEADVVLHATSSTMVELFEQIGPALKHGKNVVTIAEEACFPWKRNRVIAEKLDALARESGVTLLGTGVNPGFMMDFLPLSFSGLMQRVRAVRIRRVVDFSRYGLSVWKHIGAGLTPEEFQAGCERGEVVLHVGLPETVELTASALGWELDRVSEARKPLISRSVRVAGGGRIEPGQVTGFEQVACGWRGGQVVIEQCLVGIIGPSVEEDGVEVGTDVWLEGESGAHVHVGGQLAMEGGMATYAHAVNAIPHVVAARPGYLTVVDLPPAVCLREAT